ncbi:MFS transporter [Candidatus Saccharibacteria bacterium]|nr:MAG: MFS transporter [Candidatus Saccharibacteria bacterium]
MSAYEHGLKRNIGIYSWYKIFTKRLYLPLIAIQLVNVGKVSLEEIALIASITSVVSFILQMPGGYLADKWGNKNAVVFGSAIATFSPLFYIFMPNFWGGLFASLLFFGGYTFQSGAIEAFIHDTLKALGREKEYSKVLGRAQTYGLLGNVVLMVAVPATYAINTSLPFILGTISLLIMTVLVASFKVPRKESDAAAPKNPVNAVRSIVTPQNVILFLFAGAMSGAITQGTGFQELLFQDIGVPVTWFGFILAIGSLVGALLGWYIHILDRLKPLSFYFLDLAIIASGFIAAGITRNEWIVITAFILLAAYGRVRLIIFQAKLLASIQHTYKATLISALNLFTTIAQVGAITLLTFYVTNTNLSEGHLLFGASVFAIGLLFIFIMLVEARRGAIKNAG